MSALDVLAPATGQLLGSSAQSTVSDVPAIVARARGALEDWRGAAPHERATVLRAGAVAMLAALEPLALLHAAESGKVLSQARNEVRGAARMLEANAELGRTWSGSIAPTGALPGGDRDLTIVERVPLGVVVTVIPFNFPVELMIEKASAALATGNVVIVKLPPQNPLATSRVIDLLHEAGVPRDVLQAVSGDVEFSSALCSAPGVDAVSLTGSVGAGIAVATSTASQLRPLFLELGGNGAAIVLPGADLDYVVSETLRGRLLMNGQACAATKRIIAHRDIADELTERLVEALRGIHPADPTHEDSRLGPLISASAAQRVSGQVAHIASQGGLVALGRTTADGARFEPTVIANVPATADVAHDDEIFGPVFPVIPVESDAAALALANSTSLRLTAAVFTPDLPRAMAIAERLDFGGIVVNGTNNYRPPVVPFGGVALAGTAREGIGYTIEELTRTRFIAIRGLRGGSIQ